MSDPKEDTFCYLPFMQMLLQPTGAISPCCWNQEIVYGMVPEQTLSEVWNSKAAQDLRQEFLDGTPKSCLTQMKHIGCHKRSGINRNFVQSLELSAIQSHAPSRLDVRLNGRCNLQCLMCEVWKQPNGLYNQADFWKLGSTEIFPFLKEIDVLGGEPFVQADTYRLIDQVSAVNSDCIWCFVTNGNYHFNETIRSRLNKIKIKWIQVSVDSINPNTYSKIRIGGDLKRTLATIEALVCYQKQRNSENREFRVVASMCVQKLNWQEIPEFLNYCEKTKIMPILQFAYAPTEISLLSENLSLLKEIYLFLKLSCKKCDLATIEPIYLPIKEMLQKNVR